MLGIDDIDIVDIGIYEFGADDWCAPEFISHVGCGLTDDDGDDIIGC